MSSRVDISIKRLWRVLPFVLHEVHAVCQSGVKALTGAGAIEMSRLRAGSDWRHGAIFCPRADAMSPDGHALTAHKACQ